MRIKIKKNLFKNALDKITKALPISSPLPSLDGIMIEANESNIILLASNGTLSIKHIIDVTEETKVEEPGKILVPGRLFKEIIARQNKLIEIKADESHVHIFSAGFKTKINLLNINNYPVISFDVFGKDIAIDAHLFKKAIKNVSFAAADGDKRIVLNGVNLRASAGVMKVTATNSYRLAQQLCNLNSNQEFDITILSKNLKDFLPQDPVGEIILKINDTKIITQISNTITSSKLIDADYPDIDRLIPTEFTGELSINTSEINSILDKVTVMAEDANKVVKLKIDDVLTLEAKKREIGTAEVKTTNFEYQGEKIEIIFNGQFLKDVTSRFSGTIKLLFISTQKPFVIKSVEDDSITQLILPHKTF